MVAHVYSVHAFNKREVKMTDRDDYGEMMDITHSSPLPFPGFGCHAGGLWIVFRRIVRKRQGH